MRLAWSFALALALALCPASSALAAPTEAEIKAARKLFEQAQAHEAEGRWIDALGLLERILLVKETAGVRFHMALSRERLGQLLAAEVDYRRAAELAGQMKSAEGDAIVEQTSAALAALKSRIPLLTLRLPEGIPGLRVEIDGVALDEAQLRRPIPRDPGAFSLRASAPGYEDFSRIVSLSEGGSQTLDLVLSRAVPAASSTSTPPPEPSTPPPEPPARILGPARWPGYAVGGAALVAAGSGVFFYLQHRRLRQETDDICADPRYRCDRDGREARLSDYRTYGLLAGGVALVGAGAAAYLLLAPGPERSGAAVVVGPGAVGVVGRW
jgi:hypothetical protein